MPLSLIPLSFKIRLNHLFRSQPHHLLGGQKSMAPTLSPANTSSECFKSCSLMPGRCWAITSAMLNVTNYLKTSESMYLLIFSLSECLRIFREVRVWHLNPLFSIRCCTETGGKIIEYFRGGPRVDLQEVPERHLINKQQHKGYGVYLDGGVPSYFLSGIGRGYSGSQIYTQPYVG